MQKNLTKLWAVCHRHSKRDFLSTAMLLALLVAKPLVGWAAEAEPPKEWIEPATGHKVVRLSTEPWTSSFYFHQNGYTADGDKLVVSTPTGLSTINLKTHKIEQIEEGRADQVVVGRKSRQVYYMKAGVIYATHVDTHETREIAKLPANIRRGSGLTVNADETLLAGSYVRADEATNLAAFVEEPIPGPDHKPVRPGSGGRLENRFSAHLPMGLYTVNTRSGEIKTFHPSNDWQNHVQFSPTDPTLLMFCHEGPWHKVDRIWTIHTDGTGERLIHKRSMDMEIAGHEFFSADGKNIWFDLQTPKGKEFWLANVDLATGKEVRYSIPREEWSVHYNISRDGKLFSGDGGGPNSVASPGNGQWMYLFTPDGKGNLKGERLVDLSKHDYELEPNGTFTPDGKWLIFRSNMHGPTQVYAVELAKSHDVVPATAPLGH